MILGILHGLVLVPPVNHLTLLWKGTLGSESGPFKVGNQHLLSKHRESRRRPSGITRKEWKSTAVRPLKNVDVR